MALYQLLRDPSALIAGAADAGKYALLSLTGYGAASVCFFFALAEASPSVVAVLLYTYPAMVAVISAVAYGERFAAGRVFALVLTFAGCALVVGVFSAQPAASLKGVLLGLGAALGYSVFNLLSYRVVGRRSRIVVMTYTFGFSALGVGALTLLSGGSLSVAEWTPGLWRLLGLIVLVPTFLAVLLYLNGIKRLGPAQAAIISTTEPIFTIALAAAVLHDRLTLVQLLGAALVLAGVVAAEWRRPGEVSAAVRTDELAAV
jgi:drug/metabolite transporter (DMT)-like permease